MSAEDITMVVTWPNFSVIIGPCMLERFAKEWCGLLPSFRRFPIMGSGVGPGGSLEWFSWLVLFVGIRNLRRRSIEKVKIIIR